MVRLQESPGLSSSRMSPSRHRGRDGEGGRVGAERGEAGRNLAGGEEEDHQPLRGFEELRVPG